MPYFAWLIKQMLMDFAYEHVSSRYLTNPSIWNTRKQGINMFAKRGNRRNVECDHNSVTRGQGVALI